MIPIHFNLFSKLMISFLSLIVLPLTIVSYFVYMLATGIINEHISQSIKQTVHQLSYNSELILEDMERSIYTLLIDSLQQPNTVKTGLEAYAAADDYEKNRIDRSIQLELNKETIYRNNLSGIYIIGDSGHVFSSGNTVVSSPNFQTFDWYRQFVENKDADSFLSPTHEITGYTHSSNANVVTFLKKIKGLYGQSLGVIWVDVNERFLENIYTSGQFAKNARTLIVNRDYIVISDSNKSLVTKRIDSSSLALLAPVFQDDNGYYFSERNDDSQFIAYATIHTNGWKMVTVIPKKGMFVESSRIKRIIWLLAIACALISTIVAYFVSKRVSKPVHNLIRLMEKAAEGNLTVRATSINSDEFGKLNKNFNIMISEIQNLISTVYITNIKQKEAELASLEAQINPHFLYNTLQSIKWLADSYNAADISEMAISLAKIFHFSIKGAAIVTLYDEIQHVNYYASIQKNRYGERVDLQFHIAEELWNSRIPKLIIQPLVENAIYHGIEMKENPGTIQIRVSAMNGLLLIHVEDDGIGTTHERLLEIKKSLQNPNPPTVTGKSLGLKNIHDRLQLLYGADYGLSIDANRDGGFVVMISLPLSFI